MYPGQIPTLDDIQRKLYPIAATLDTITSAIFHTESWRPGGERRFGRLFQGNNPTPSQSIEIDTDTRQAARDYAPRIDQVYYRDHNMMDEFYHWMTGYGELPDCTEENIIPRLKHPIIVYSTITQHLVRVYKDSMGTEATKILLEHSCIPWMANQLHPVRKWNLVYRELQTTNIQWPDLSLSAFIRRAIHETTTVPTPADAVPFLKAYNTKATESFAFKFGSIPAYKIPLGIELELENLTPKAQPILTKLLGQHAIFKRDGSVSNGVEICTAPATLDIHKEVFKTFFENKETGLKVEANCGLHVHVERKTIKQTQLAKIMLFMNNPKNNTFIEHIAGRKANTYCQREDHSWSSMINTTSGDKYKRVNLAPSATIEFRLFASTLDYGQFSRCLEFVQAVIDYTKSGEHNCSIKEMVEKGPFIAYVEKNRQYYPELLKFIKPELIKAKPAAIQKGAN